MKKFMFICFTAMFFLLLFAEDTETIVKFESNPAGAEVIADGKVLCKATPCSKMLTVGSTVEIEMRLPNYLPLSRKEVIKEGSPITFTLQPNFAWLSINSNYDGEIKLDGQPVTLPLFEKAINPGEHKVELDHKCFNKASYSFNVKQGEKKKINFNPKPLKSSIKIYAQDESENDLAAEVYVDNALVGKTPGTFEIPLCSKQLSVTNNLLDYSEELSLEEKQTKTIQAKLKRKWSKKALDPLCFFDAIDYCENLKEDGYDDWRLPNIDELRSLIKNHLGTVTGGPCMISRKNAPLTDRDITSDCSERKGDNFSKLGDKDEFWAFPVSPYKRANVNFSSGEVSVFDQDGSMSCGTAEVRCIRSEPEKLFTELQWSEKTGDPFYDCKKQNEERGSDILCAMFSRSDPALYCKNLNEGGYTDWRWPSIDELRTLIQNHPGTVTGGKCMISEKNQKIYEDDLTDDCKGISGSNFSKLGDTGPSPSSTYGYVVNFTNGAIYRGSNTPSDTFYRCVRDKNAQKPKPVQAPLKQKNLQWSEKAPTTLVQLQAREYCKELREGGYKDWRLPTINDLRTLIQNHPGTVMGGTCKIYHNGTSMNRDWTNDCAGRRGNNFSKLGDNETFWSSSMDYIYDDNAWFVSFSSGEIYSGYRGNDNYGKYYGIHNHVRCVRGENTEYKEMTMKKEKEAAKEARQKFLVSINNKAQKCYERYGYDLSKKQKKSETKISVTFEVDEKGYIRNPRISEDTLGSSSISKCIIDHIGKHYPKSGNDVETITIPFTFNKQEKRK